MNALKRFCDEEECSNHSSKERKRLPLQFGPVKLTKEELLLLKLKEEEDLPWTATSERFKIEPVKSYRVPALQMGLKRLRGRMGSWTET